MGIEDGVRVALEDSFNSQNNQSLPTWNEHENEENTLHVSLSSNELTEKYKASEIENVEPSIIYDHTLLEKLLVEDDYTDWIDFLIKMKASPIKVLSLFDVALPEMEGSENEYTKDMEESLWSIVAHFAMKFTSKRRKLAHINTLFDALRLIQESRRILVLTGAGISVSCGIPDFRSPNGLYARLKELYPNIRDPQTLFDIRFFLENPEPFFSFARELFPGNIQPSLSHYFIKLLEVRHSLLRNYTQNIDTLENQAGIQHVLQCHGSFSTATCTVCHLQVNGDAIKDTVLSGEIPFCVRCSSKIPAEDGVVDDEQMNQMNTHREPKLISKDMLGIMKPDIVFFGEQLPKSFEEALKADQHLVDLVLVIGSSLKVQPVASIMDYIPKSVPQILINKESIKHVDFDVELIGDCDKIIDSLCRVLGWESLLSRLIHGDKIDGNDENNQETMIETNEEALFQAMGVQEHKESRFYFEGGIVTNSDNDSLWDSEDDYFTDDDSDDVISDISDDNTDEDTDSNTLASENQES